MLAVVGLGADIEAARGMAYESIARSSWQDPSTGATSRLRRAAGGELAVIGNVLANRYATAAKRDVGRPESKIISERRLWLAVLAAQHDLGEDFGGDDPAGRSGL